jgi:REP element-mobilizing transposase RayT
LYKNTIIDDCGNGRNVINHVFTIWFLQQSRRPIIYPSENEKMMSEKYKNKYRIKSARLENWDYGSNGMYFITICTQNREHFFGDCVDEEMQLNAIGELAYKYWNEIPKHFPFITLGEFVVMPNHTHGILIIDKPDNNDNVETQLVETQLIESLQSPSKPRVGGVTGMKNPMLHQNISRIIRWYKGRCTFEIWKLQADFTWQARFHDHIIRNDKSFHNISNYIMNNPSRWDEDKFNNINPSN